MSTANMDHLMALVGTRFGVLAESNTDQLTVIARDFDVAVGDLFLLPSRRGPDRFYIFRTTQYANILNRLLEMGDLARNKLTMPDSYLAQDYADEKLIELKGLLLGYAEWQEGGEEWSFHRPRRLPEHLSDVFHVHQESAQMIEVVNELLRSQLGQDGIYIGDLLAGEQPLQGVPVMLPPFAFSHHLGIFGRTGSGKSNLMMVLLRSILAHNRSVAAGQRADSAVSIFAIDPHDEFNRWHSTTGGANGIHGIVMGYSADERARLVEPFYYLSAKNLGQSYNGHDALEQRVWLSRADIVPDDLISITEFSEQQIAFANQFYGFNGEQWIGRLLTGDPGAKADPDGGERGLEFLPGTISAVERRLGFLRHGTSRIVTRFDPELGRPYSSTLPDILCALEQGRVLIVDTTLMSEMEQFLLTTVVARVLFSLRKALRAVTDVTELDREIRQRLGNDDEQGQIGMRSLADELVARIENGALPYVVNGKLVTTDQLPVVNIVVEEAPSVLNPQRIKFGSVFRDISFQGRKFGIGLTVVSQQVSEIDRSILTQLNTELTMSLGNENERREAIRNASADLYGFERELQVMGRGQVIVSASYKDVPLPLQVPEFDSDFQE